MLLKLLSAQWCPSGSGLNVFKVQLNGLEQDCSNAIADALELPQSCTKPSKYSLPTHRHLLVVILWASFVDVRSFAEVFNHEVSSPIGCFICRQQCFERLAIHGWWRGDPCDVQEGWCQVNIQSNRLMKTWIQIYHFHGLVQDCSNSSALAMELLQSCTKPSICDLIIK